MMGGAAPTVTVVVPASARVGEGPVWDCAADRLHWVDIVAGAVHTSDLRSGETVSVVVPTSVGAAVPRRLGGFVAATAEGFASISEAGELDVRCTLLAEGTRMNDAKCDARGRLWAGSTGTDFALGAGALHVLEPDWSTRVVLEGLTLPNGMGWSPRGDTFYLIDTIESTLQAFAFDVERARLSEQRLVRRFDPEGGLPDGMCIDSQGRLWVAMWGAGRLLCLSPSGQELFAVDVPVRQPSACAFAGPHLTRLAVTTAREGLDGLTPQAMDGSVLIIDGLPATGLPTNFFLG